MLWSLAPNISFCWIGGQAVLLDVARDRYFALPRSASRQFRAWLETNDGSPPPEILTRSGLLVLDAKVPVPIEPCDIVAPRADLDERWPTNGVGCSIASAARSAALARLYLKVQPLERILSRLRETCALLTSNDVEPHAFAYAGARARLPLQRQCLPDSLAMLDYLRRHGRRAQLVFGVMTEPFGAHCWVQSDTAILNDSADNVSRFTPILAL